MAHIPAELKVQDVIELRRELEDKLATAVQNELRLFEGKTGFTPSSIDVSLARVQRMDQPRPDYLVDRVRVSMDIF